MDGVSAYAGVYLRRLRTAGRMRTETHLHKRLHRPYCRFDSNLMKQFVPNHRGRLRPPYGVQCSKKWLFFYKVVQSTQQVLTKYTLKCILTVGRGIFENKITKANKGEKYNGKNQYIDG